MGAREMFANTWLRAPARLIGWHRFRVEPCSTRKLYSFRVERGSTRNLCQTISLAGARSPVLANISRAPISTRNVCQNVWPARQTFWQTFLVGVGAREMFAKTGLRAPSRFRVEPRSTRNRCQILEVSRQPDVKNIFTQR